MQRHLVFISHASGDKWVAGQLEKELNAIGVECFLDSNRIETGDEFDEELKQALHASTELLVLLSPAALDNVRDINELDEYLVELRRRVGHG